jgi:hypothetical protein
VSDSSFLKRKKNKNNYILYCVQRSRKMPVILGINRKFSWIINLNLFGCHKWHKEGVKLNCIYCFHLNISVLIFCNFDFKLYILLGIYITYNQSYKRPDQDKSKAWQGWTGQLTRWEISHGAFHMWGPFANGQISGKIKSCIQNLGPLKIKIWGQSTSARAYVIWHVHLNVNPAWVCKTQAGFPHFYVNVFFFWVLY